MLCRVGPWSYFAESFSSGLLVRSTSIGLRWGKHISRTVKPVVNLAPGARAARSPWKTVQPWIGWQSTKKERSAYLAACMGLRV